MTSHFSLAEALLKWALLLRETICSLKDQIVFLKSSLPLKWEANSFYKITSPHDVSVHLVGNIQNHLRSENTSYPETTSATDKTNAVEIKWREEGYLMNVLASCSQSCIYSL